MLPSLLVSGLAVGSIYALVGLALVLVNKATGVVNFAQGEMATLGAFVVLAVYQKTGWPMPLVFVIGLVFGGALGAATERLVIRPLAKAPPFNLLITTIGIWFVFNGLAGWLWGY